MMTIRQIKDALRAGQYAWPGGYPCFFIASDGEALSFSAVRSQLREVFWAAQNGRRGDQWGLEGVAINYEDANLYCAHTNKRIESAYAEDESAA